MQRFQLYKQLPKPSKKPIAHGYLEGDGKILFFSDGQHICAQLDKAEIVCASRTGILLRGYEPDGADNRGRHKWKYQEWWCPFNDKTDDDKTDLESRIDSLLYARLPKNKENDNDRAKA